MILIIFSISFVIAITIILIWFSQSDRDLEVAFAERFGFSIGQFVWLFVFLKICVFKPLTLDCH